MTERTYFDDKAPRRALWVTIALAGALTLTVVRGAVVHRDQAPIPPTVLEPCALVMHRDGSQVCR